MFPLSMLQYILLIVLLKIMDEFKEKNGFIVDFWNDDTIFHT
jgi:hypothetical protein